MINIYFVPDTDTNPFSDAKASRYADFVIERLNQDESPLGLGYCSNYLCILSICVAVKKGELKPGDIVIHSDGKTVYVDRNGTLSEYTPSMDYFTDLLFQLL